MPAIADLPDSWRRQQFVALAAHMRRLSKLDAACALVVWTCVAAADSGAHRANLSEDSPAARAQEEVDPIEAAALAEAIAAPLLGKDGEDRSIPAPREDSGAGRKDRADRARVPRREKRPRGQWWQPTVLWWQIKPCVSREIPVGALDSDSHGSS